jgi:glycosyltransferase involved in cell wall biosynthesis
MQKISACILTYNEAEKIEAAVSSVLWADEVVVVDSFSTDRTADIARSLGARVVDIAFNGFGDLRNRAIEACNFDWIFSLDSDERCTPEVRDEILGLLAGSPPARNLYGAAPQLHDGPLDPRLWLVSEFSSTPTLSQGQYPLHARASARRASK